MNFAKLAAARYSVRAYESTPVEQEKLEKILEAMRLAPSACNRQPYQFIIIHTEGRREELSQIYRPAWFVEAPLVICACVITYQGWTRYDGKSYSDVDVAIAMDHLILAATELGLGTCWIGAFDVAEARKVLGLPDDVEPIAFTPLGYPAICRGLKRRKQLNELVRYEHW